MDQAGDSSEAALDVMVRDAAQQAIRSGSAMCTGRFNRDCCAI
jgi:hypothetical protein